jgi:hypothetical protein
MLTWREATLQAIRELTHERGSRQFSRPLLIQHKLGQITAAIHSTGQTPEQTLSRVLQELRDEEVLHFLDNQGGYWLLDEPLMAEAEDFPDDVLDAALGQGKLGIGQVETAESPRSHRQRHGQQRLRHLTLTHYHKQCALCDVAYPELLIASHVVRWGDDPLVRGNLANVICFCRFHDALFEHGFMALANDYTPLWKPADSQMMAQIRAETRPFRLPSAHPPSAQFLDQHRQRTGFDL